MVLDMDRHALFLRVEARPLGHRPAQQHAVELEPEVVVQAGGPVLLDDEAECVGLRSAHALGSGVTAKLRLAA